MPKDPETFAHLEWLGYVQPVGLVVSVPALLAGGAHVNRNIAPEQLRFRTCLPRDKQGETVPEIHDFPEITRTVLGWDKDDLLAGDKLEALEVPLPEYNETLRPTFAVKEFKPKDAAHPWLLLIQTLPAGTDLDKDHVADDRRWQASPHAKFERLLRETEVPIGLLCNATHLRLVYAPRGETSGYLTFAVAEMATVAGRPIFAALHMLLSADRLFSLPEKERLPSLLSESRKYQNVVSTQLAQQVMAALFELLRGLQAADNQRKAELLRQVLAQDPNQVYSGLLTVLMRLVFILYAEDRGLLSSDPIYANYYSVTGLFDRLRADAGRYPDTMDQRYGGWAQFLTLFRLIHEGGKHADFQIPARKGYLFDSDRYPFLEGRLPPLSPLGPGAGGEGRSQEQSPNVPQVSDGVLFRVLSNLLILDGERLSYRTLDVEQIGSVYEAIMGFDLEVAKGRSIAIKPAKTHGAPATINLEDLLAIKAGERTKWLAERTDQKITGQTLEALKKAASLDDLLAALEKKIARQVTPNVVPKGAMIFQPSDERRRSGSHYTPRSLTEPIVRKTLEPILRRLGFQPDKASAGPSQTAGNADRLETYPTPKQLLELKVCDPAMGSGAFLVEACRQLGDVLVKAWHIHKQVPRIPLDEDEILHARRLIAQRCLYGVDKNTMAVDLAKLSLWLATLAKDHPFTFLDHALRHGDSLVGLTKAQIAGFHWEEHEPADFVRLDLHKRIEQATRLRTELLDAGDTTPYLLKQQKLALAEQELTTPRRVGNLVVAAFFGADKLKARQARRDELYELFAAHYENPGTIELLRSVRRAEEELLHSDRPITPFHWEIEFPEVFGRENGGFDGMVGNPPFMGGSKISSAYGDCYLDWLLYTHSESHGNGDIVAHFFRRAFTLVRPKGTFGLIATNTIAQGDTRTTGLRWICTQNGTIYSGQRRYKWPGQAAVVVSILHVIKGNYAGPFLLNDKEVPKITAYLFHGGGHENPATLLACANKSFLGSKIYGQGFVFEDEKDGLSSPLADMNWLIEKDKRNAERIFPYIGGEEVNDSPTHANHRFVINFGMMTEQEARRWPDLMEIVERKVKPERMQQNREIRKKYWWRFGEVAPALYEAVRLMPKILANSQVSQHLAFAFLPTSLVYSHALNVFAVSSHSVFCALQSRCHEIWGRFFASSLEDRLRYTPSDCFGTFPFPENFETDAKLEAVGQEYYEFRAALMVKNNEGLTKTYNRFHDPNETSAEIKKLRELHAAMDRAVLDAYGWTDLKPTCEFLLDYEEEEEDNGEPELYAAARRRKKPWRYRWPDDLRDEVLARLLELNKQRAEEERLSGAAAEGKPKNAAKRGRKKTESEGSGMF